MGPKLLVFGKTGQLALALQKTLSSNAIFLGREEAPFTEPELLKKKIEEIHPSLVINAAAYTAVDKAEEEKELCHKINAEAPGELAAICKDRNIPFFHISTDYVFDGEKGEPYNEKDDTKPLGAYGQSKFEGEKLIQAKWHKALILRTSWLYGTEGSNFLLTMLKLGKEKDTLKVVKDQFGAPTYVMDLADAISQMLKKLYTGKNFPFGLYHISNSGSCSWQEFAETIFETGRELGFDFKVKNIEGITTKQFGAAAPRPKDSRLDCSKLKEKLELELPNWQDGLKRALETLNAN